MNVKLTTNWRSNIWCVSVLFYWLYICTLQVSHIDCVSYEEAQDFVEDDTTHG